MDFFIFFYFLFNRLIRGHKIGKISTVNPEDVIHDCQEVIGYRFDDPELLSLSLTHASRSENRLQSNERLEFFGDAILGMVVCEELFYRYPDSLEGELTRIKSSVVSRHTCAKISKKLGIEKFILLGKGMGSRSRLPQSILAGILESLIGAIFLDGGWEPTRKFIIEHVGPLLDKEAQHGHDKNYKSILQQKIQRKTGVAPFYEILDEKGPDHHKCFEISVVLTDRRFPSAWGPNKKSAEQKAAKAALDVLKAEAK